MLSMHADSRAADHLLPVQSGILIWALIARCRPGMPVIVTAGIRW